MTQKSIFYLVVLIFELVVLLCATIVISRSIKNKQSTGDYLKYIASQIILKAIIPTSLIFAVTFIHSDFTDILLFAYLFYFFYEYSRKQKYNPPSSLRVPSELRPYYWQIAEVLSIFNNCEMTYRIFESARVYLYSESHRESCEPSSYFEGHNESDDKDYDRILKSDLYDEKCETWALCFILFVIDEGDYRSEKAEAIKMYVEYRLKIRCRFAPTEFLRAFRACKFIGGLYEQQLQDS